MYTPCLPLTSSDEYVHAVGQYMKPFASTPKSGGGVRRERDLRCHRFTTNRNRKRNQCNQIFHRKYRQNPLAKKHAFLIRRHIVIERVRMKLSNMLPGVVSKSIRDYFLPIFDHCYFVVCNYRQRNPLGYIHPATDWGGSFSSLITTV